MHERLSKLLAPRSTDEVLARKEHILNIVVVTMGALSALNVLISGLAMAMGAAVSFFSLILSIVTIILCALAYWMGQRGWIKLAGYIPALSIWGGATSVLLFGGWHSQAAVGYVLSVVLATFLSGGVGGTLIVLLSLASYLGAGYLFYHGYLADLLPPGIASLPHNTFILGVTLVAAAVLVYLIDRQLTAIAAQRLRMARERADELEQLLKEREELIAGLEEMVRQRERLSAALRESAAPVLPILEGLIVIPLIGPLDPQRVERLLDNLLRGVAAHKASYVLLDITGVPTVDEEAAQGLLKAIDGARLLGSKCVLVGVRPTVARELVMSGVDLADTPSYSTLREGLVAILEERGLQAVGLAVS